MTLTNSLQTLKENWKYFVSDNRYDSKYTDLIWKYIGDSHWYTQSLVSDLLYCFDELYRNCRRNFAKISWIDKLDWTEIASDGIWTQSTAIAPSVEVQSILDDVKVVNTQQKSNKQLSIRDQWMFLQANSEDIIINRYLLQNAKHHFGFLHRTIEITFYDLTGWYLKGQSDGVKFAELKSISFKNNVFTLDLEVVQSTTSGNVFVYGTDDLEHKLPEFEKYTNTYSWASTDGKFTGDVFNNSSATGLGDRMDTVPLGKYTWEWTV